MDDNQTRLMMLFRFLCAFAWADMVVQQEEVDMIERLMSSLDLKEEGKEQVRKWLKNPPPAEEIDPYLIPLDLQNILLDAAQAVVLSDGEIHPQETELLNSLKQIFEDIRTSTSDDEGN